MLDFLRILPVLKGCSTSARPKSYATRKARSFGLNDMLHGEGSKAPRCIFCSLVVTACGRGSEEEAEEVGLPGLRAPLSRRAGPPNRHTLSSHHCGGSVQVSDRACARCERLAGGCRLPDAIESLLVTRGGDGR